MDVDTAAGFELYPAGLEEDEVEVHRISGPEVRVEITARVAAVADLVDEEVGVEAGKLVLDAVEDLVVGRAREDRGVAAATGDRGFEVRLGEEQPPHLNDPGDHQHEHRHDERELDRGDAPRISQQTPAPFHDRPAL